MSFADTLKFLLEEHEMSQSDLAKSIGYSQRAISKWVNKQAEPSESAICLTANFFGLSVGEMLGRENDFGNVTVQSSAPAPTEEERELLSLFGKMTHAQKVRFVAYGEGLIDTPIPQRKA